MVMPSNRSGRFVVRIRGNCTTSSPRRRETTPARMGMPGYLPDHGQERRADYLRSTPGERLAEAMSLSRSATRLAGGELDVKAILRALVAEDVEFLVIGDLAVAAHEYPRATEDLDIIPRPEPTNLERLHGALAATAAMKQAAG